MANALFSRARTAANTSRATVNDAQRIEAAAQDFIAERMEHAERVAAHYVASVAKTCTALDEVDLWQFSGDAGRTYSDSTGLMADALKSAQRVDGLSRKIVEAAGQHIGPDAESMDTAKLLARLLTVATLDQRAAAERGREDWKAQALANSVERFTWADAMDRAATDAFLPVMQDRFGVDFTTHVEMSGRDVVGFYAVPVARFDWNTALNAAHVELHELAQGVRVRGDLSERAERLAVMREREGERVQGAEGISAPAGNLGADALDGARRDESDTRHAISAGHDMNGLA